MRQANNYERHEEYRRWLSYLDKYLPHEAEKLKTLSEKELSLAFAGNLEFGTGGLRGIVGWGSSLINKFTIERTTAGFAKYISGNQSAKSVLIAYDTRRDSQAFARAAAGVMLKRNIEVYLFNAPTATPILSYGIRKLEIGWGIIITASHNSKEYNGYKCYDARGVQLLPLPCQEIMNNIAAEAMFGIDTVPDAELETHPLFHIMGEELTDLYLEKLFKSLPNSELTLNKGNELGIVYSALHGCGAVPVPRILRKQGFGNCHFLQTAHDHEFGGIDTPNPEEPTVYDKAIRLARERGCKLILTTDPDSDRTGVCICEKDTSRLLTGNQVAALLTDYLTTVHDNTGKVLVTTVVSGEMAQAIARARGISVYHTLTGFKYIGDLAQATPICFGYEESCGYMTSTLGGDKDGIEAAALIAEMTLYHLQQKRSLYDRWLELGEQYGYYTESQLCRCTDTNSFEQYRRHLLEKISSSPSVGNGLDRSASAESPDLSPSPHDTATPALAIRLLEDYSEGRWYDHANNTHGFLELRAEMIKILFDNGCWLAVRPSGTENKIKYYFSACGNTLTEAEERLAQLKTAITNTAVLQ